MYHNIIAINHYLLNRCYYYLFKFSENMSSIYEFYVENDSFVFSHDKTNFRKISYFFEHIFKIKLKYFQINIKKIS